MAVRRPDAVRFEALSPSGDFLAILVSDGERFVSFERGRDECFVGPACPVNVGRLLPLALPPEAVVQVLLGEAPLIAHGEAAVAWDDETGRYDVTLAAPDRGERQRVAFSPSDLLPRATSVHRGDDLLFRVTYGAHRGDGALRHARRFRFRMPEGDVDLSLEYRDVELNPDGVDEATFAFTCPAGTEVWELSCDGSPPRRR